MKLNKIIPGKKNRIIIALDTDNIQLCEEIIKETCHIRGVGAYKPGFEMAYSYSLPRTVNLIKRYTNKPIIYDHQKAGNDTPHMGERYARLMKKSGIDAVILFPFTGPESEKVWIESAQEQELGVIVGAWMTIPRFRRYEGGSITDESILQIYERAADLGVSHFVVPGNDLQPVRSISYFLKNKKINPTFYSPGFIEQGGSIKEFISSVEAKNIHPIVGRAIYESKDIVKAARMCVEMLYK